MPPEFADLFADGLDPSAQLVQHFSLLSYACFPPRRRASRKKSAVIITQA
jgi:hypothetical protein